MWSGSNTCVLSNSNCVFDYLQKWGYFSRRDDLQSLGLRLCVCCWSSPLNSTLNGVSFSSSDSPFCLLMFGCLFSLSLKRCLTVPIYDNRPLTVYRNNCTVTRRAESRSLLQHVAFSQAFFFFFSTFFSDYLQEQESRPPACWLTTAWRGLHGGREQGRAVKCYRNSWLKRGNGRYITSSIDTDRVGARLNCSSSGRLDYGHRVVTPVP